MTNDCPTIYVSLTTISSRLEYLGETLDSLLNQSYKNIKIYLFVSREPFLLDKGINQIPETIGDLSATSNGRLIIKYCKNVGPYRKLVPFLQLNWGKSCLVATADDDTIYPIDWLEHLYRSYCIYKCVVAYRGHYMKKGDGKFAPYRAWMKGNIECNPSNLILPTGKDGVLYDTAFFPPNILNIEDALSLAPTADDLWFRWNLALNGIAVYLINTSYTDSFPESEYSSSLYLNYNRQGNNDKAIEDLEAHFKRNLNFSMFEKF